MQGSKKCTYSSYSRAFLWKKSDVIKIAIMNNSTCDLKLIEHFSSIATDFNNFPLLLDDTIMLHVTHLPPSPQLSVTLPSEWYTSISALLPHTLLLLPCFSFLWSCRAARFGILLLAVSYSHTMASNNKLDVIGSTQAERRWQTNAHLHAGLDRVQPNWKAADSHL